LPIFCGRFIHARKVQKTRTDLFHAHFLIGQHAETPFELDGGNGLNLLQVERTRFEEWFWDAEFPTVATE